MPRVIEAVYDNGVFKPLQDVSLERGLRVVVLLPKATSDASGQEPDFEQWLRSLGYKAFEDVPDEEWDRIAEGWKRG